jgi:uncharacterized membrane protein HdeD (DUF308 family)
MIQTKVPGTLRALEVILGAISVAIGFVILFFPGLTIVTIVILLAVALLFVGLIRFFWGLAAKDISSGARGAAVLVGVIAVLIAVTIIAFPDFATGTVVIFIDVGVLIYAFGRIATGATARNESTGLRGLQITTGVLMLVLGAVILFDPGLGADFLGLLLGMAFLIIGFESAVAGIVGRRYISRIPDTSALEP